MLKNASYDLFYYHKSMDWRWITRLVRYLMWTVFITHILISFILSSLLVRTHAGAYENKVFFLKAIYDIVLLQATNDIFSSNLVGVS